MKRCLDLAALGALHAAPNPRVGCVIVHQGRLIGEGYHRKCGQAHAEVNAINAVEDPSLLPESVLYVSLEPCTHQGKTPPCADLIVKHGIKRVFVACTDPFAKVNGEGIRRLRAAGTEVDVGMLEKEAKELNRRFFVFHQKKRPYIILKWAETADGFVDAVRSDSLTPPLKISGTEAQTLTHKWRTEESAIMVARNTVALDDPRLTARRFNGPGPVRVILDSDLTSPTSSNIFDNSCRTIIINRLKNLTSGNTEFVKVPDTKDIRSVLGLLFQREMQSVLVEGGPTLHRWFYDKGIWDEARRFVSSDRIGDGPRALTLKEKPETVQPIGRDELYTYRNR